LIAKKAQLMKAQIDSNFHREVEQKSHAHLNRCYQCFTCTLGCPVAYATDFAPNQIIRLIQLGQRETVLKSDFIWICAACETCAARCPNDIEIVKIMDTLRIMSLAEQPGKKVKDIAFTHQVFMKLVKTFGRIYELGYIMGMKIGNPASLLPGKALIEDAILGYRMFSRGKFHIFPHKTKGAEHIQNIAQRIAEQKQQQEARP